MFTPKFSSEMRFASSRIIFGLIFTDFPGIPVGTTIVPSDITLALCLFTISKKPAVRPSFPIFISLPKF